MNHGVYWGEKHEHAMDKSKTPAFQILGGRRMKLMFTVEVGEGRGWGWGRVEEGEEILVRLESY